MDVSCNSTFIPPSNVYLRGLGFTYTVLFSVCACITLSSVALYIEQLIYFYNNLQNWKPKDKAVWLIGIYPVYCVTSFIALLVPRSSALNEMIAPLYLSVCVYFFVTMLIGHYGGASKMCLRLADSHIPLASPPLCCCCVCLPKLNITSTRLQVLKSVVLQYAILRPIASYIEAVTWSDKKYLPNHLSVESTFLWLNLIMMLSTMLALYGFVIVYRISCVPLEKMCIKPKFLCLQLVLVLANMQSMLIAIFVKTGVIPCEPPLNAKANGERWNHIITIMEMILIALVARIYYRRHVGDLPMGEQIVSDDQYRSLEDNISTNTTDSYLSDNEGSDYEQMAESDGRVNSAAGAPPADQTKIPQDNNTASASSPESTQSTPRLEFPSLQLRREDTDLGVKTEEMKLIVDNATDDSSDI